MCEELCKSICAQNKGTTKCKITLTTGESDEGSIEITDHVKAHMVVEYIVDMQGDNKVVLVFL
jgi:hypothetical protein